MIIFKAIFLQLFWYIAVVFGKQYQLILFASSFAIAYLNYFIFKPKISLPHYSLCLLLFTLYGIGQEALLDYMGLVSYGEKSFPPWPTSLYVVFLCYYGDIFNYMKNLNFFLLALIGGAGGVAAFFGGEKLSSLTVLDPLYYGGVFISWFFFFPLSFKIFYTTIKK